MVICLRGRLWITQERDPNDYVLTPGELFIVSRRGTVLIQALAESTLQITPSMATVY
jgi:hypothetical protein